MLLSFTAYTNISHSTNIIEVKSSSFGELREAGEFVKENVPEGQNIVVGESYTELLYYSGRQSNKDGTLNNKTDLLNKIEELDASYLVMPMYYYVTAHQSEGHIEVINYVFGNPNLFIPVKRIGQTIDQGGQINLVTIFKINL